MCSRSGAQASAKYGKMAEQCQVLLQQNLTLYPHRLAMRRMGVVITANNAANTLARRLCAQHHDHEQHDVHHGEQQHHDRRCRRRYHGRHHLYRRRRRRNRRRQPPPPWPPKRGTLRVPSLSCGALAEFAATYSRSRPRTGRRSRRLIEGQFKSGRCPVNHGGDCACFSALNETVVSGCRVANHGESSFALMGKRMALEDPAAALRARSARGPPH